MDVFKKELNTIYARQHLDAEKLDSILLDVCRQIIAKATEIDGDCRVITDVAADYCYIYGSKFFHLIGLDDSDVCSIEMDSGDEDVIYNRIHPEDLVDKRMLEYEFFRHIDLLPPDKKLDYKATCRFRIKDCRNRYVYVDNNTRVLRLSNRHRQNILEKLSVSNSVEAVAAATLMCLF